MTRNARALMALAHDTYPLHIPRGTTYAAHTRSMLREYGDICVAELAEHGNLTPGGMADQTWSHIWMADHHYANVDHAYKQPTEEEYVELRRKAVAAAKRRAVRQRRREAQA